MISDDSRFLEHTWAFHYIMSQQYTVVSVATCRVKMSHRTTNSMDDTLPLDKNAPGFGFSGSNQTYYRSDLSVSTNKKSNDSSVKIVYEVINLTDSKSDNGKNQGVNLRFGR